MPIETAIWRIDGGLKPVVLSALDSEKRLEDALSHDLSIIGREILLLGRQVPTPQGKRIDILAVDAEGSLVVAELKRDRTPRDVVAQVLDYAAWVKDLSYADVTAIYAERNQGKPFEAAFEERFGSPPPEELNETHDLIVVCSELDPGTERILTYIAEGFGVPINAVFFRYYRDGDREYLTRTWLIPPDEAEEKKSKSGGKRTAEPWNGRDYYVSLGEGDHRTWEDCRKYGFVSAGGGKWYTQTLSALKPGNRVFVNVPGSGYVGVGEVISTVVPVREAQVEVNERSVPLLRVDLKAKNMGEYADDPEMTEKVVRVRWLNEVPRSQAYWEKGLFAKQHSACKLRNKFTIEKVTQHFGLTE